MREPQHILVWCFRSPQRTAPETSDSAGRAILEPAHEGVAAGGADITNLPFQSRRRS